MVATHDPGSLWVRLRVSEDHSSGAHVSQRVHTAPGILWPCEGVLEKKPRDKRPCLGRKGGERHLDANVSTDWTDRRLLKVHKSTANSGTLDGGSISWFAASALEVSKEYLRGMLQ